MFSIGTNKCFPCTKRIRKCWSDESKASKCWWTHSSGGLLVDEKRNSEIFSLRICSLLYNHAWTNWLHRVAGQSIPSACNQLCGTLFRWRAWLNFCSVVWRNIFLGSMSFVCVWMESDFTSSCEHILIIGQFYRWYGICDVAKKRRAVYIYTWWECMTHA